MRSLTTTDAAADAEMEHSVVAPDLPTTITKIKDLEAFEGPRPVGPSLLVINTASMDLEIGPVALPLVAANSAIPAIADYSPLKWKRSKKIYHTMIVASLAFIVWVSSL